MNTNPENSPLFLSLGMLILDELHLPDGTVRHDVLGGSGTYSTLGARLAVDVKYARRARRIGSFILAGDDFPHGKVEGMFGAWGIDFEIGGVDGMRSSRGRLEYLDWGFERKTYEYQTTPLQPRPRDLSLRFLRSSAFHLLSSADVLSTQIAELERCRLEQRISDRLLLVWEPAPLCCIADFRDALIEAARLVDVFSPNHVELLAICGSSSRNEAFDKGQIEECASRFLNKEHQSPQVCVVRCAEHGAVVVERSKSGSGMSSTWVNPFLSPEEVVDATGAGNTFLGAFTVEYQLNERDAVLAARKASVAASFALEQVGLPECKDGRWNGTTMNTRMEEYSNKTWKSRKTIDK